MHKAYKAESVNKSLGRIKEYTISGTRRRIDFIDFGKKTIYELKPNNPRSILQGQRQLQQYKTLIEQQFGPGWKTVQDLY